LLLEFTVVIYSLNLIDKHRAKYFNLNTLTWKTRTINIKMCVTSLFINQVAESKMFILNKRSYANSPVDPLFAYQAVVTYE